MLLPVLPETKVSLTFLTSFCQLPFDYWYHQEFHNQCLQVEYVYRKKKKELKILIQVIRRVIEKSDKWNRELWNQKVLLRSSKTPLLPDLK